MKRTKAISIYILSALMLIFGSYSSNSSMLTVHANGETLQLNKQPQQSTIGGVEIGSLKGKKLKAALEDAIQSWKSKSLVVSGGGVALTLDTAAIQFDVDATISLYDKMTDKPWYAFWKPRRIVHIPLQVADNLQVEQAIAGVQAWVTEATYAQVMNAGAYLISHEVSAIVADSADLASELILRIEETVPSSVRGLQHLIAALDEQTVAQGEMFSLLERLDESLALASSEALNLIASMMYSLALQINGEIIERTAHTHLPQEAKAGMDAVVERDGSLDLRFNHKLSQTVSLQAELKGDKLILEAYAPNKVEAAKVRVSFDYTISPRSITRFSRDVKAGQQHVMRTAQEGASVTVYRLDTTTNKELRISRDYYQPVHEIVLQSALVSEKTIQPSYPSSSFDTAASDAATASGSLGIAPTFDTIDGAAVLEQVLINGEVIDIWDGTTDVLDEIQDNGK